MLKTPSTKSVTSAAVQIGSGVAGAKLSDGVVAILPDSLGKMKKPALAIVALIAAASVNASTAGGQAVQAAFVGMAVKQGANAVSEALVPMIAPKDGSKTVNQFINAVVGHNASATIAASERFALNAPWNAPEPTYELMPNVEFSGL